MNAPSSPPLARPRAPSAVVKWITLVFLALSGLYLIIGGGWLVAIGGSPYYLIAGIVTLVIAWLVLRASPKALWLYALLLLGTLIWAIAESGFDFWALASRLDVLVLVGIWMVLPFVLRIYVAPRASGPAALGVALVLSGVALGYAAFNDPQQIDGTVSAATSAAAETPGKHAGNWLAYGNSQAGTRYSPLAQINDRNVSNLREAWRFRTGDMKGPNDPLEITDEVTPLAVDGTLYFCTPHQQAVALDGASGKQKWRFDPQLKPDPSFQHVTCRGVSYYETPAAAQARDTGNPSNLPMSFLSPVRLPCKQPAWGYVAALDLDTNQVIWKKRIGTTRDSSPIPIPFKMGMPMLGGPMTTAGHVFFIAATADDYLRAFSTDTGAKLWEARLPAGGQATPMTYEANGKQYVLIAAGGHGSFLTKLGDYVIAYALPDNH
ncbi:PQQ-binding-like beta-propeller repeat protein [Caballeronia sp. LZ035]|nr:MULTISPECIES: PQQ-binding-like beta-propeller repeat protein [unclassified Caballeronia]MDR5763092.1 PQQ-binding-like beta-propeller repeat protein [Caballeronia sp. LZ035]MDR5883927.1 PQQ-binding-like beta-propeller repeat protein [Caballeronia sp. LZ032]